MYMLDTIRMDDQEPRKKINELIGRYGMESAEVKVHSSLITKKDSINQQKVRRILQQYGWPSQEMVGHMGSSTVFLVIQHADLPTQLTYLPLLKSAVASKKLSPSSLALLEDRIALQQGKK